MDTKEICNKIQVERYLLNRMTEEEEFLFQKHLTNCESCRRYITKIRKLASVVGEEGFYVNTGTSKEKTFHIRHLRFWMSTAACILLLVGISTFWYNKQHNENILYPTTIEHRNRATNSKVEVKLLYPNKDTIRIIRGKSLLFKWEPESSFHLKIKNRNKIILDEKGYGQEYSIPIKTFTLNSIFTWNITIDSLDYSGVILNETNK